MLSDEAESFLESLDGEIAREWHRHCLSGGASNEILQFPIGDGLFDAKMDGLIHAVTMTSPFILRYADDAERGLTLARTTAWRPQNNALKYAKWQVEFHWKIDTRPWQYLLLTKYMRRAYDDAIVQGASTSGIDPREVEILRGASSDFWDEVEVAYSYFSEIIERARKYDEHPDLNAGSDSHGYTYERLIPPFDYKFSELRFEFIGQEFGAGADESARADVPPGFPALDGDETMSRVDQAALAWLRSAKDRGIADELMRAPIGDRLVPTRFTGWVAGVRVTQRLLDRYGAGDAMPDTDQRSWESFDLESWPVRFGIAQAEFWRRLDGEPSQLTALLRSQETALAVTVDPTSVAEFMDAACDVVDRYLKLSVSCDADIIPELEGTRPVHPRFASFDPMEPLPWETRNPERHQRRMRRLGYTI